MAGTRRSARVAESGSAPIYNEDVLEGKVPRGTGKKRKTQSGSSPAVKRGKKAPEEQQQILVGTL